MGYDNARDEEQKDRPRDNFWRCKKMTEENRTFTPAERVRHAYDKGYKAVVIADKDSVKGFPVAYKTWLRLWNEYEDSCHRIGKRANKKDFLKVIYGLEGNLLHEDGSVQTVMIYAKNNAGIQNLYRIVTASNLVYFDEVPLIPENYLYEHSDGLIVAGSVDDVDKALALMVEKTEFLNPLRAGRFLPEYPNADEELTNICTERVKELFGDKPDHEVKERLERELNAIKKNGYASIYMIWRQLVKKSLDEGYLTGIRGRAGASFVAYLCKITDINPLSKKNGGHNIPPEVFMGLDLSREPDIFINFATEIQDGIQKYVKELPGVGETCHCGTVNAATWKYNGIHPGGIFVCPKGEELVSFTPLTHPFPGKSVITEFDYHELEGNLLKLDILGHKAFDRLHALQEKTGVRIQDIPFNDEKVLGTLCSTRCREIEDFPEFGDQYVRAIINVAKPKTFDDLVKVSALSHGTGVWGGNQDELVKTGQIRLSDCIASRDDIMLYLMATGISKDNAYRIMDSVRKGRGLNYEQKRLLLEAKVPDWYIKACGKIHYLFPKSHCVAYTMMAVRLAYYMVYWPDEYYET